MSTIFTGPVEETITAQLKSLEQEKKALEKALRVVRAESSRAAVSAPAKKAAPRKKAPAGRKKQSRADQALAWVKKNPGGTAAQLADSIGVSRPHAHQIMGRLVRDKEVRKKGPKYTAVKQ